jgi:hypothetical protein
MIVISFSLSCRCTGDNYDAEYKCDCIFCPEKGYIVIMSDIQIVSNGV